jgi:hypothetical protein
MKNENKVFAEKLNYFPKKLVSSPLSTLMTVGFTKSGDRKGKA